MRQWELQRITDREIPLVAGRERRDRRERPEPRLMPERFPIVLWTTDVCLGFTAAPPPGTLSIDIPLDPSDGDLFDLFAADDAGIQVVEAHLGALRGESAEFTLSDRNRVLRCLVSPLPDDGGRTVGTLCIALEHVAAVAPRIGPLPATTIVDTGALNTRVELA
jgi:hypothetical protein